MKKFLKNNVKIMIAFTLGAFIFSGVTYAATLNFASGDVEHTKLDGSKTTVLAAINELYAKSKTPTRVTGNAYTGTSGYLNGNSSLTVSTQLTLSNYKNNNKYAFILGGKEQITLPSGYYDHPIVVANGASREVGYTQFNDVSADSAKQFHFDVSDYTYVLVSSFGAYSVALEASGTADVYIDGVHIERGAQRNNGQGYALGGRIYDVSNASDFMIALNGTYTLASASASGIYAFK